eukprot:3913409-Rhodomonas_salina.1
MSDQCAQGAVERRVQDCWEESATVKCRKAVGAVAQDSDQEHVTVEGGTYSLPSTLRLAAGTSAPDPAQRT